MVMAALTFALRPINLVATIVLARLLSPSDFGAVALAMVLLGTTNLFSGLGMGLAVIHSQAERGKVAFQAFIITVLTSTLLFVLTLTNAGWLAVLLGQPEITPVLAWLSLLILFNGWSIVPSALLKKDLLYGRVAYSSIGAQVSYTILAIILALLDFGIWSLVYAQLISTLVGTILDWALCPGWDWIKPKRIDWDLSRDLLRYGLNTTGGGLVGYFTTHWDDWLVGRQLGTAALGFYTKAFEFTNRLVTQLSGNIVGSVFFASFAQIQDNTERLSRAYLKSVRLISLMMFPIGLGILATGPLLVPVMLGDQWLPMIRTLQVYALMVLTRPISSNTSSIYMGIGKPRYALQAAVVLSAIMVPLALLLLPWGIVGVATAVVIADYVGLAYNLWRTNTILPGSARESLRATLPILAIALVMFVVVRLLEGSVTGWLGANLWSLLILVAIGVVVYGLGAFLTQRPLLFEIIRLILAVVDKRGRLAPLSARLGVPSSSQT